MFGWYRRHWAPWPWLDALAKRGLELVLAYGGLLLLTLWLRQVVPPGESLADTTSRPHLLLVPILAALFFVVRGVYRVIVHPVRAAITGRFLDEEAPAGMPAYRRVPPEPAAAPQPDEDRFRHPSER